MSDLNKIREALEKRQIEMSYGHEHWDDYRSGADSMMPLVLSLVEVLEFYSGLHEDVSEVNVFSESSGTQLKIDDGRKAYLSLTALKKELGVE